MARVSRLIFLAATSLLALAHVHAQEYWVKKFGGLGGDRVHDVKTDANDNVYVAGEFTAGIVVDGQVMNAVGAADGFVAKLDSFGALIWMKALGGPGIDRCWKLALGSDGALVVTGQYVGPANLLGTNVPATNGMWHAFLAELDAATGNAFWVRTGGGSNGATRPNGVTVAPGGNITIAGEFTGTTVFDAGTLSSLYDPLLQAPGSDVFIASYAANGDALWLKQGAAEFTDKAVDVVNDPQGNVYVCGQFSDTITFDLTHANAMVNAIFLLKLDPSGNEVWFRVCGGGILDVVNDMLLTSTGELLMCGDLRGNMFFLDGATDVIHAGNDYACFLLQVDTAGEYVRHGVFGSDRPVSAKAIDQRADTVAVLGTFQCQFSDLTDHYNADGLFMATGPQDLFVSKHAFSDFQLREAQQFGGRGAKWAGGVTSTQDGSILFSSTFEKILVFPGKPGLVGDVCNYSGCGSSTGLTFDYTCNDPNYGSYMAMASFGLQDGILAKALVRDRSPYDFWNPDTRAAPCSGDRSPFCICSTYGLSNFCGDTLLNCGCEPQSMAPPLGLAQWSAVAWSGLNGFDLYTAPGLLFDWSSGDTTSLSSMPPGWNSCTVSTTNGCWSWTDSVFLVSQCIEPHVSDDVVVNTDAEQPQEIDTCSPFWAWTPDIPPGYSCQWYQQGQIDSIPNDSLFITHSGNYVVEFTSPGGCTTINGLHVEIPDVPPLDPVDSLSWVLYSGNGTPLNDTLFTCPFSCAGGYLVPTWWQSGQVISPNEDLHWSASSDCVGVGGMGPNDDIPWSVPAEVSGWTSFDEIITIHDGLCGDESISFEVHDSVYVYVVGVPTLSATVPSYICAGDTLLLLASCTTCDSIYWSDGPLVGTGHDSAWVTEPGGLVIGAFNTELGVTCQVSSPYDISAPAAPFIGLYPTVICPGDSALLITWTSGTDIQWTGSTGVLDETAPSLYVHEYGDYYLSLTDANGCVVSGGPVTLSAFGSPYLLVEPDQVLCPGEELSITVMTTDADAIQWNAPLAGSDTIQWITEPGTYGCSVTSCGQTQTLTVQLVGGHPSAEIVDPGPFSGCVGQTFELAGAPGQALYIWSPLDTIAQSIIVDTSGIYQLVVADPFGCFDTSAVVVLLFTPSDSLFLGLDTAICPGVPVMLTATGPYTDWLWSTGDASSTTVVDQPGLYTVSAYDPLGCLVVGHVHIGAIPCEDDTWIGTIPNVVTPNGDGVNDGWGVDVKAPYNLAIIYNRWGNEVYRGDPRVEHWHGQDPLGQALPAGVYFYALTPMDGIDSAHPVAGYIQLVRP